MIEGIDEEVFRESLRVEIEAARDRFKA